MGVNDEFVYSNLIHGKSVYNALDVKDYTKATSVTYTLELFRKTTVNGSTDYVQVNMPEYITDIELTDTETGNLTKTEHTKNVGTESVTYYEYSRNVDPNGADKDAMFYTDFARLFYTPIVYVPNALRTSDAYYITAAMILAYIMPILCLPQTNKQKNKPQNFILKIHIIIYKLSQ